MVNHELLTPEVAVELSFLGLLVIGVLTEYQRKQIRERDSHRCQFPIPHNCHGRLEIHHIAPQGWEKERGICEEDRDVPENLLTICQTAHHMIHPDELEFHSRYHWQKTEARNIIENRRKRLNLEGIRYWFTAWDVDLKNASSQLTDQAKKRGWTFKDRKGKLR